MVALPFGLSTEPVKFSWPVEEQILEQFGVADGDGDGPGLTDGLTEGDGKTEGEGLGVGVGVGEGAHCPVITSLLATDTLSVRYAIEKAAPTKRIANAIRKKRKVLTNLGLFFILIFLILIFMAFILV